MKKLFVAAAVLAAGALPATGALAQQNQAQQGAGQQQMGFGAPVYVGPSAVERIQQILSDQGHYQGNVDGIWGERTAAAVRQFQESQGMPGTGNLNLETLSAMGLDLQQLQQAGQQTGTGGTGGTGQQGSGAAGGHQGSGSAGEQDSGNSGSGQ